MGEWEIADCEEEDSASEICICGKENIKYLFTIRNTINGNMLYPIGSSCIKKFNRADMKEETSLYEGMFKLLHAVESNRYLSLSSELFSRKLLKYLFKQGAFNTKYNNFDGEEDYEFMLKMFNKRDKSSITMRQEKNKSYFVKFNKAILAKQVGGEDKAKRRLIDVSLVCRNNGDIMIQFIKILLREEEGYYGK